MSIFSKYKKVKLSWIAGRYINWDDHFGENSGIISVKFNLYKTKNSTTVCVQINISSIVQRRHKNMSEQDFHGGEQLMAIIRGMNIW